MKHTLLLLRLAALLWIPLTASFATLPQMAVVERNANLRKDPSATKPPIRKLLPDEKLQLLDSAKAGYVKVKAEEDGKTGWVWKASVKIIPPAPETPPPPPPPAPVPPTPGGGGAPATVFPMDLPKQAPVVEAFTGSEGACKTTGDGGDTKTNFLKNRSDALPPEVFDAAWPAVMGLTYPAAPASRLKWSSGDLAKIQPYEGVALRTVGFLAHQIKVEMGTGESTNCHFTQTGDVDWHMYLVAHNGDGIDKSVVVETTPRIRKDRSWDLAKLRGWVDSGKPVRISGYLMLDPEHRSMVGSARGTVWEIHPVMKIELCNAPACSEGDWVDLESIH